MSLSRHMHKPSVFIRRNIKTKGNALLRPHEVFNIDVNFETSLESQPLAHSSLNSWPWNRKNFLFFLINAASGAVFCRIGLEY